MTIIIVTVVGIIDKCNRAPSSGQIFKKKIKQKTSRSLINFDFRNKPS
jgi:hypothetical protein